MAPNYITYAWDICDPLSENLLFSCIPQIPQSLMIDNLLVETANISICTVTIGQKNYRRLNNQMYLRTEINYEDMISLIALTIAC